MPPNFRAPDRTAATNTGGFTLIELLVVMLIIGIIFSVVLPRAQRASNDAKFAMIRQHASEIASHVVQWGQDKVGVQYESGSYTLSDVMSREISGNDAVRVGFSSKPLINRYTGDAHYEQISGAISGDFELKNPFNNRSYFHPANDDRDSNGNAVVPSPLPGLLYMASGTDGPRVNRRMKTFYFIITGKPADGVARWYGNMGPGGESLRHGVFIARVPLTDIQRIME